MSRRAKAALASGLGLVALTATYLAQPWEGKSNVAYWDRLGRVWTICYGETKGVKPNMRMSDQQCTAALYRRMETDYHQPLTKCIKGFDGKPLSWQAAALDLSWNVGVEAVCRSTAAKRARAGDHIGSCYAMTWFNKAGGEVVDGLDRRRKFGDASRIGELELCLAGL
ncbi:MAG TPA: lysozyme [Mesorhizobium sp.]|jgi:lysozyme|uniref:lysozyme n=1 Tax=Mesorhizobium sp. TaxID=1871066 RepID=UPI002DDD7D37|nr:lysozyme [Mesorhizobium sp.]HEV2502317.1 lysozyme [Mesorhizobium sp.]